MTSLRETRKRYTKARLYETGIALFRERGFEDVSVAEIAEACGVAKGTFFNYYPTKDHLLAEYHGLMSDRVLDGVVDRDHESCEAAVLAYVDGFADWGESDPRMMELVVRRIFANPVMFEADQRMVDRALPWFVEQVDRGVRSGELKADVDRDALISLIAAVLSSVGNAWALAPDFDGRSEAVRRMRFVFDAARA